MSRILVTGGAGMIGSNLVKQLVALNHDVEVVDDLSRGTLDNLKDNGDPILNFDTAFHKLDLTNPKAYASLPADFDYVYHLADVVAGIGFVFRNQLEIFRQNLLINTHVVDYVKKIGSLKGYIYVGTACSFPLELQYGVDAPPLVEEDQYPANPESAYGMSKLMGEYEAFLLQKELSVPVSVLSLHNVYGTPSDFDLETAQVIPALAKKAIDYPIGSFTVWGDGSQGRAFVHVNDVVTALIRAKDLGLNQGLIQIGPSTCTSIKTIAETLVKISGKNIDIEYDTSKPTGDQGRCADYSKAKRILDWEPTVSIEDGLSQLYEWIKARTDEGS